MDGKTVEASTLIRLFTGVSIDPSCSIVSFLSIFKIIEIGNDNTTFRKTMLKHFWPKWYRIAVRNWIIENIKVSYVRFNWNYGKREINWRLPLIGENSASYLGLPISISQFFTQQPFSCWKVLLRRVTSMSLVHVIAYRKHTLHLCRLLYIFLIWLFSASFQSKQVAKNQRVNFSHPCESVPNPELTVFFLKKMYGGKTMNDFNWMCLKKGPGVLLEYQKIPQDVLLKSAQKFSWCSGFLNDLKKSWESQWLKLRRLGWKGSCQKRWKEAMKNTYLVIHGCPVHWITERLGNLW